MNKPMITVTGNLGSTPELRHTPRGTATTRLRIASTERKRALDGTWGNGDTTWYTVIAWGALAEATAELAKGAMLIVHGNLANRNYTDNTGAVREAWEITAETIGTALRTGPAGVTSEDSDEEPARPQPVPARRAAPAGRLTARR